MQRLIALIAPLLLTGLAPAVAQPDPQAVAARVGGAPILLREVIDATGSLALVGKEHAGEQPGARERVLERLITARVLTLDGRDRRLDQTPEYREDLRAFTDPVLAARYTERLRREQQVSAADLDRAWQRGHPDVAGGPPGSERAHLVRQILDERVRERRAAEMERLRRATAVSVHREALDPAGDHSRADATTVATVGEQPLSWRRVRAKLSGADFEQRILAVNAVIDTQLLADEARRIGLDADPGFRSLVDGFERREMIKLVREEIIAREGLDAAGVRREYDAHIANFTFPEARKVQQIVVRSRAEAEDLIATLRSPPKGVTFYTLARDRSIEPHAVQTLGVLGWVTRASGDAWLAEAAFSLRDGETSAPIERADGVHVARVIESRPAEVLPLDTDTEARIRARWNANRIREYANELAARKYSVELHPEVYSLPASPALPGERG